ncbi:hypothetical protein [Nocardia colli]|uniref:hypothetical protein n=1 Tax=Nocardia colli TaxID=2545717 RepID=UPI0035DC7209
MKVALIVPVAALLLTICTVPTEAAVPSVAHDADCQTIAMKPDYFANDGGLVSGVGERYGVTCAPVAYEVHLTVRIGEYEILLASASGGAERFETSADYRCDDDLIVSAGAEYRTKVGTRAAADRDMRYIWSEPLAIPRNC